MHFPVCVSNRRYKCIHWYFAFFSGEGKREHESKKHSHFSAIILRLVPSVSRNVFTVFFLGRSWWQIMYFIQPTTESVLRYTKDAWTLQNDKNEDETKKKHSQQTYFYLCAYSNALRETRVCDEYDFIMTFLYLYVFDFIYMSFQFIFWLYLFLSN